MTVCGGGVTQTQKEKTLELDFSKKEEGNLTIISTKHEKLPEIKLKLEDEDSKLDVPKDLFDYSTNNVSSKIKDIFLEIEKESRVNEQKKRIQEFEELAKSIKKAIPNVFGKLIDRIPELLSSKLSKNGGIGDGQSNENSSREQAPTTMTPPVSGRDNGRDTAGNSSQEQHLEKEERGNCVIDSSAIKNIFQIQQFNESEYYFVSCTKEENDEDVILESQWGGAFPKVLFKFQGLNELTRLDIRAKEIEDGEIQNEGEDYVFVFEFYSDQFNNFEGGFKVIGDFKYENEEEKIASNEKGAIVKLTKPKNIEDKIYLLIGLDENNK